MKRKISISTAKSANYLFSNFFKQFKKALDHHSVGEMLNSKQVLSVICYMGFVDEQPTLQDVQLAKTLTKMLSDSRNYLSVKRMNLFHFLMVLCDIPETKQSVQSSYFEEEASGLANDHEQTEQPLIVIQFGQFDGCGKWSCSQIQREQIKTIFASMRSKRISRIQVQSRKKTPKKQQNKQLFKPKICPKSSILAKERIKKVGFEKIQKVENRLMLSKDLYKQKIQNQLNHSVQKQLQQCTFKPNINYISRSQSKENRSIRSNSQGYLKHLLDRGNAYKEKRQRLKQLQIKINQSTQMEKCTFKPQTQTTKHSQSAKWVYVRNRDKQIERLRQGRKQRQFMNQVKERGYPTNMSWNQFLSKKTNQTSKTPILCIDLKIMNQQENINVFDGQNIIQISERISRLHKIPEKMWWKVEQLIRNSIQQCPDIKIQNNRIFTCQ